MITLENTFLTAVINPFGAELSSLTSKETAINYLWSGDAAFWPKHSPVLFPVVGALREGKFSYGEQEFSLGRHGFAREMSFDVERSGEGWVSLVLRSSAQTLSRYPFPFVLRITYTLDAAMLTVTYEVENPADQALYFSIGAHPAFNVPLVPGTGYEDYFLRFSEKETAGRWLLQDNLILEEERFLEDQDTIQLKKELFYEDALVFKSIRSRSVSLLSDKTPHGLRFDLGGFPYLGIWAAKGAPFVCIEPWQGIADSVDHDLDITGKEGIVRLEGASFWSRSWAVEVF
jgi:galactose mutarotase-like enzyme